MPRTNRMPERWREIAGPIGRLEPGRRNSITDVPGVRVGHAQAESGQRTGVTVVEPPTLPTVAGTRSVNGMGELTGSLEIEEAGILETPVHLCGSHAVGTVHHAAVLASDRGPENIVLPVVGECDDGDMADSRTVSRRRRRAGARRAGRGRGRGQRGRGHRHDVLRVPGRDRHRFARRRRAPRGRAPPVQLRRACRPGRARDVARARPGQADQGGLLHRGVRDRRPARPASAAATRPAPAARPRARRLLRRRGIRRDRARVLHLRRRWLPRTGS